MHKVNPHTKLCFSIIVLCLLNIVTAITLFSNIAKAESASSTASVTVPEACTMTSHNDTPHTATLSPNTYSGASGSEYANGIGKTTLTATCNDDNGFAIYAIGYTGNSYDSENHNKLVGQSTNVAINTAVYASGDTTSSWSMKVNKINDSTVSYNPQNMSILDSFDSWHIVPATYTKVAEYHANTGSSTTDTTLGAKVETTYAAYIAENQAADTYIGQVKYTMVHPYGDTPLQPQTATSGCINYFPNGSNVEGTMGCQSVSASDTSKTLIASNFSRQGYGFAGWSNKYDYATNPTQEGIKFYGPQEEITFTAGQYTGDNDGLALYAIWIKSQGNLQNQGKVAQLCGTGNDNGTLITAPTDGTANLDSVSALTDQRDNETYAIAKLADGNCWMIENLRLESTNSDNSAGALAQGYGKSTTYGNFSGLANAENTNFTNHSPFRTNSIYYSGTQEGTASVDIGTTKYPEYRIPRYNNKNTSTRASSPTHNNTSIYSYGNYYNWPATVADTGYYNTDQQSIATSICPKGWRLPKGSNKANYVNNDYWKLVVEGINEGVKPENFDSGGAPAYSNYSYKPPYGETTEASDVLKKLQAYPNNLLRAGYYSSGSSTGTGVYGYYSTATVQESMNQIDRQHYQLSFYSTGVYPGDSYTQNYLGNSVRCIVAPNI